LKPSSIGIALRRMWSNFAKCAFIALKVWTQKFLDLSEKLFILQEETRSSTMTSYLSRIRESSLTFCSERRSFPFCWAWSFWENRSCRGRTCSCRLVQEVRTKALISRKKFWLNSMMYSRQIITSRQHTLQSVMAPWRESIERSWKFFEVLCLSSR
jgi:hypothetical protein